VIPDAFWPQSLLGWLTVLGLIGGGLATVMGFVRNLERLNGLGDRLNALTQEVLRLETRTDGHERAMALSQADRTNLHESVARIATQMQTLMKVAQDAQLARVEDLGEIRERLVRIETKVDRSDGDRDRERERDREGRR